MKDRSITGSRSDPTFRSVMITEVSVFCPFAIHSLSLLVGAWMLFEFLFVKLGAHSPPCLCFHIAVAARSIFDCLCLSGLASLVKLGHRLRYLHLGPGVFVEFGDQLLVITLDSDASLNCLGQSGKALRQSRLVFPTLLTGFLQK